MYPLPPVSSQAGINPCQSVVGRHFDMTWQYDRLAATAAASLLVRLSHLSHGFLDPGLLATRLLYVIDNNSLIFYFPHFSFRVV